MIVLGCTIVDPSGRSSYNYHLFGGRTLAAILILFLLSWTPIALSDSGPQASLADVFADFERGNYRSVISKIEQARTKDLLNAEPAVRFSALMLQSESYRMLGMNMQAMFILQSIQAEQKTLLADASSRAVFYSRLGSLSQQTGDYELAGKLINNAVDTATKLGRPDLLSVSLNDLGNLNIARGNITDAITSYTASVRAARESNQPSLIANSSINLSRTLISNGTLRGEPLFLIFKNAINQAQQESDLMVSSKARVSNYLAIGELYIRAQKIDDSEVIWRKKADDILNTALSQATILKDNRQMSYALGYLGQLYEYEGRYAEALVLTRKAEFLAQSANADEALYQWEWQTARLLVHLDKTDDAIAAYRRAINALSGIRTSMLTHSINGFREQVGPLYFEMADLLLTRTVAMHDKALVRQNLLEVRQTLEQLKAAEIVDYFDNDCVVLDQGKAALDRLASTAAILYPVILADRIELLLSLPDEILQFSVPVSAQQLTAEIRQFRLDIESTRSGDSYLDGARRLYQWLVEPYESLLEKYNIDTLVVVPDGALRTIPMSALYDGNRFLVEKYALATTPGLSLTNPKPINKRDAIVLADGITKAVQGFSALTNVSDELTNISRLYNTTVNIDEQFKLNSVEQSMSEGTYNIVHIATHGHFDSDYRKSFLLAYDDKLTMNRMESAIGLRRYQEDAVELLVLSACQTAAGDDRAALGMAGIALKAGARSALATLWFINDASTSELMTDFYRNLKDENITKAQALQKAQVKMLSKEGYRHPAYWAPFLLIGNWL